MDFASIFFITFVAFTVFILLMLFVRKKGAEKRGGDLGQCHSHGGQGCGCSSQLHDNSKPAMQLQKEIKPYAKDPSSSG